MALVKGSSAGAEDRRSSGGVVEGDPLPESALAQIFAAVSDRASRQGGKVLDMGQAFFQAIAGEDAIVGEAEFEEASGLSVDELVAAVREAARERGVEDDGSVQVHMVDKVPVEGYGGVDGLARRGRREAFVRHHPEDVEDWALTTMHEAAHLIAKRDGDDKHDEAWRDVYVGAVRRVLGDEVADAQGAFYGK